jgi:putative ABC transport system substrate-binding protein
MSSELSAKRLELLHAVAPRLSRVAILWDSSNPGMALRVQETEIAAKRSHVALSSVGPRNAEELEAVFADLAKKRPDALLVTVEPFTRRHLVRILEFCRTHRVPSMFEESSYVESGGLMSYGPRAARSSSSGSASAPSSRRADPGGGQAQRSGNWRGTAVRTELAFPESTAG